MTKVAVIVGTVRRARQTTKQVNWVVNALEEREGIEATVLDLKDFPLPFFDEPISVQAHEIMTHQKTG